MRQEHKPSLTNLECVSTKPVQGVHQFQLPHRSSLSVENQDRGQRSTGGIIGGTGSLGQEHRPSITISECVYEACTRSTAVSVAPSRSSLSVENH